MSSFRCAVVTLLAVLGLSAVPSPVRGTESYLPRGIYVLVPAGQTTVDLRVLADPNVSGLQIRANWSKLQPRNNTQPDFTYFDDLIALARSAGKTVIIAVRRGLVGQGLPHWIPGPYFTCFDGTKGPLPWSAAFEEGWIALWTALVQRYENEPVVVGYHLGGIYSWKTADWDLCDVSSADREELLRRGYRVEYIQQFALDFAAALAANTTKPFVLPIAGTMDNSGAVSMDVTNTHIIAPLFARYGPTAARPQFGIMRTIFRATTEDPLGVWNHDDLGEQFRVLYAWSPHIAGQRAGSYNLPRLGKMLDISLHYGVQFMELGTDEIVLPGAGPLLACYRDALVVGSPEHCAHQ